MKHKTVKAAIERLRVYAGYIGCACTPEVHRSRRVGAHRSKSGYMGCARGDFIETINELRRLARK